MNFIRQRWQSLRQRARDLQATLRRWALYDGSVSRELKEDLLARLTPGEEAAFESDQELTKLRLKPLAVRLGTISRWYDYVLEQIHEQLDRAGSLINQGHFAEAMGILTDVEVRMVSPSEETLGYVFRCLQQHASHEHHQKLAALDAILRDLYLPTAKIAHQRGLVRKELLSKSPAAYIADAAESSPTWRSHERMSQHFGRRLPISLSATPRRLLAEPWNLVGLAHEVGLQVCSDLELGWELASKLQTETISAGVRPETAAMWARWHETLFADVFGVLKLGPAYVGGMIELLGADVPGAITMQPDSAIPPAYLRWQVMLQTMQLMNFTEPARGLYNEVHLMCGDPNQVAARCGAIWTTMAAESRAIAGTIALSPCQKLGSLRVVDIAAPFTASEQQMANKVRDLLVSGDESCSSDEAFSWAESISDLPITAPIALAGLRAAFESAANDDSPRKLWIRFWCLMQLLTGHVESARDREDREYAPADAMLKNLAQQAAPVLA